MHEQDLAIIKALVSVAWVDGVFADRERQMIDALLEAYHASAEEKDAVRAYAAERRSLKDIPLQDLSAADRRLALEHAVLLSFADGAQSAEELGFLRQMAAHMNVPDAEAQLIFERGAVRARRLLALLE